MSVIFWNPPNRSIINWTNPSPSQNLFWGAPQGVTGATGASGATLPITVANDDIVMVAGNGYQANDADDPVLFNFPLSPATGNVCAIYGGAAGGWMLDLRAGETVQVTGGTNSVSGPSHGIQSSNQYDSAMFVFLSPNWIGTLNGCALF